MWILNLVKVYFSIMDTYLAINLYIKYGFNKAKIPRYNLNVDIEPHKRDYQIMKTLINSYKPGL